MDALSLLRTAAEVREHVSAWRVSHQRVALVPTMGNLHDGHLSLARLAREHADRVIMTIFVNPTQFGVGEDFKNYPRTLAEDRQMVDESRSVDALFVPGIGEIYPRGVDSAFRVQVPVLGGELCGVSRPGHFDGVASVVLRLLNIVSPDLLLLGRKDFQQFVILRTMIEDLRLPVQVLSGATRRHADGLAISSRNRYLTDEQRAQAHLLHSTLESVSQALRGGRKDYTAIERDAMIRLDAAGFRTDYVEVRVADDLAKPNGMHGPGDLIVLGAAWLGRARLIDNVAVTAPASILAGAEA